MNLSVLGGSNFFSTTKDTKLYEGKPNNHIVMRLLASGVGTGNNGVMATLTVNRNTTQEISHAVITAAMRVHSELGPGLLESTYTACLQHELGKADSSRRRKLVCPWFTMASD